MPKVIADITMTLDGYVTGRGADDSTDSATLPNCTPG
jgi:hypothetical protein